MKEEKVIRSSQHGFTKEESCLTNPTTFYDPLSYEEGLEQTGPGEINVFIHQGAYKKDGARLYAVVPHGRTRAIGTS